MTAVLEPLAADARDRAAGPAPFVGDATPALLHGVVTHVRHRPTLHRLRQRTTMLWVDVDRAPELLDRHPLWSARRSAPVELRARDHLDGSGRPLGDGVRDLVEARTGERPDGPVLLLAQPRTFGWGFNPLSVFVCFATDRRTVTHVVLEVTSTPWGERRHHVLAVADAEPTATGGRRWIVGKDLHVSPFLPMDLTWDVRLAPIGDELRLHLRVAGSDGVAHLDAKVVLTRGPLDRRAMGRALRSPWLHPLLVSAGIHWHALRLALRRTPVHRHPTGARRRGFRRPVRTLDPERSPS